MLYNVAGEADFPEGIESEVIPEEVEPGLEGIGEWVEVVL